MPYIHVVTNEPIGADAEAGIKKKLGRAIEAIPGKSEKWLMVHISGNETLFFGEREGTTDFVTVKVYGKASPEAYSELTKRITAILEEELHAPAQNIYVQYEECNFWGWNGNNFS